MTISELVETEDWKSFNSKLEFYSSIMFVIGFVFLLLKIGKPTTIFVAGLSSMTLTYFFIGFNRLKSDSNILSTSFYKVHGWSMALGYLSIMFGFLKWPFPVIECFYISSIGLLISLIMGVRAINNGLEIAKKNLYFIRLIVTAGFMAYSYLHLMLF